MLRTFFLGFLVFLCCTVTAQVAVDTLPIVDSIAGASVQVSVPIRQQAAVDSIIQQYPEHPSLILPGDSIGRPDDLNSFQRDSSRSLEMVILHEHPYLGFKSKPLVVKSTLKEFHGKEMLFYVLIGYLLFFAFLRQAFAKYFMDLFRLFFRTTIKQRQIREQLIQTPLPSLLFNAFFVLTTGLYINILLHYYNATPVDNFWLMFLYCCMGLSVIYFVKYLGLMVSGWLFSMNEAANAYIFVVFLINKVIGIFLLPFIVLLSFMQGNAFTVALVLSWCGIGLLLLYRFLLTYVSVRNLVRFNLFHFLLYLVAFEIAPLLLVYKALMFFFR